jgi:hypothetical protein
LSAWALCRRCRTGCRRRWRRRGGRRRRRVWVGCGRRSGRGGSRGPTGHKDISAGTTAR